MARAKTCKACKAKFTPDRPLQSVCTPRCGLELARKNREKESRVAERREKADRHAARRRMKTRSQWANECQAIVNRYVRLRDAHLGCVSCDKGPNWHGQWHASHLRSVGSCSALRFHLWNINKSCSVCNSHLSANLAEYLPRLRARIGDAKVDWLYQQNEPVKYDIDYLKRLKHVMSKRVKRLEKRLE